jgi:hypothetical protein
MGLGQKIVRNSGPYEDVMPPPIRYPLPTLIAVLLVALVAWRGAGWFRGMKDALTARWQRAVEGPPVPASNAPQVVAGAITRRALLLHDDTPFAPRPGASPTDAIARRMFVDVYDAWPLDGPPTHFRVGNRRPIGWVAAGDCLEWSTRLVLRVGRVALADRPVGTVAEIETGESPLPIHGWEGDAVEVAVWDRDRPWSSVARRGWVDAGRMPAGAMGVLVAREELPALLALAVGADTPVASDRARLRAVLGRLVEPLPLADGDVSKTRAALPPRVLMRTGPPGSSDRIADANADPRADASWGGHAFRFVPIEDLP